MENINTETVIKDLAFLPLDLPEFQPSPDLYDRLYKLYQLENSAIDDDYRNCKHIPIYITDGNDANNYDNKTDYNWTSQSTVVPELVEYIKNHVQPWANPLGRIMIMCTRAGEENPPHIDCSPDKFDKTLQHKWRMVLHGDVDSLYYITETTPDKEITPANTKERPFMMSGSWPHGMRNNSSQMKFTLAMGSPWDADETDGYTQLIENSFRKFNNYYLSKKDWLLPEDHVNLYEEKYK